jgi:hypothetical protein
MNSDLEKRKTVRQLKTSISKTLDNLENKSDGVDSNNKMSTIVKGLATDNKYKERIIIDITNFLKRYFKYFNDLDFQLNRLDKKISNDDSKELIDNVNKGMNEVTDILTQNISALRRHYEKSGISDESMEMKNLRNFENGHAKLLQDLKYYQNSSDDIIQEKKLNNSTINTQKINRQQNSQNSQNQKNPKKSASWFPSFDFLFSPSKVNEPIKGGSKHKYKKNYKYKKSLKS